MKIEHETDKYFWRASEIAKKFGDTEVEYAVFLRTDAIVALNHTLEFLSGRVSNCIEHFPEGSVVPSETKILTVKGWYSQLSMLETLLLQKVGYACISAYNAYKMCLALPDASFMDMHARHGTGLEMNHLCSYGASIGSQTAQLQGAKGFIGGSQDETAYYFDREKGIGTIPHALIGYAGSTLSSVQMYLETFPEETMVVALVDYYGKEITDSINTAYWMLTNTKDKKFGVRLDTHGGRFAEGLDYSKSVNIVCNWLHAKDEYDAVRRVMGNDAYDMDVLNINKDKIRKILFGTGVSLASVINLRQSLDANALDFTQIIVSSGFDVFKCKIFGAAKAPVDMVGTGSFLPKTTSETYATADIISYGGKPSVKVGREWLLK